MTIKKRTEAELELPANNCDKAVVKWTEGGLHITIHQGHGSVKLDKFQFKDLMVASQDIYADLAPQVLEKK